MIIRTVEISVSLGNDNETATVRISGRSLPIIVSVLGVECDDERQPVRIYLRNKIHTDSEYTNYVGWVPTGAISTILTKVNNTESLEESV